MNEWDDPDYCEGCEHADKERTPTDSCLFMDTRQCYEDRRDQAIEDKRDRQEER